MGEIPGMRKRGEMKLWWDRADSPVAAAQQRHAVCLHPEVTERNICHQVAEVSCLHSSPASWGKADRYSALASKQHQLSAALKAFKLA